MKIFLSSVKCKKKKKKSNAFIWFLRIQGKLISAAKFDERSFYKLRLLNEIKTENDWYSDRLLK